MVAPDLKAFILRSEVLHLYRQLLRAAKGAQNAGSRAELRGEIRRQFDAQRGRQEPEAIRFLLSDGKLKLKQLGEMLGMQT
ncbi:LYR family of Fe S cluster biogenesis [Chlorella sorokiniana]|uniref:LYR motif-containing protein 2 n=1 Tax=Chlorella sorokiniana TaxID=3076 RepID=A0A2P6TNQ5_CHLSO|nr:LYR family of Fe S cluster biogenesis [Chlorella sorokiniana]|eukprot:PRW50970.1 LYR family of Fe S cluster biogenesis [Chlorella sorokiniana]